MLSKQQPFGLAAAAVDAIGRPGIAITFAVVVGINTALATVDRDALQNRTAGWAATPSSTPPPH